MRISYYIALLVSVSFSSFAEDHILTMTGSVVVGPCLPFVEEQMNHSANDNCVPFETQDHEPIYEMADDGTKKHHVGNIIHITYL